ncbi:AAA family ATPase [Thermosipho atlanticus]|uniref:ATPase domain-containing protein n=1 Tax=Thermosipho atlanticus DSM 15807 TaxID=1123380 RepID=A0A1M5RR48_9BACT|nr:ATP-binding protein [Thermosipho atlanticus]SHH28660.1 hypothetical protein SAMN02745199_0566 [Thermosipho atlanticus DSM 15807]
MVNPFKFGVVVKGHDFCDRENEINEIISDIKSGVSITLISPRRYGKTSLILNIFDRLNYLKTVYIDLMGITTIQDFLDVYVRAFFEYLGGVKKITASWKKIFPNLEDLQINFGPFGASFKVSPSIKNIEEVIALPEKIGGQVVVALDEFQEITNIKEIDLLALFRKKAQLFENTTFIFSGSRRHVMYEIFSNLEKPFYRFSKIYNLGSLNKEEAVGFVKHKFESTNIKIDKKLVERLYEICMGHPYYMQYISHILWNISSNNEKCYEENLEEAVNLVLLSERPMFEALWDSLTSNQKMVLKSISYGISPYDLDISAGSVKAALDKLKKLDVVEKINRRYNVVDPFFSMWLKNL